MKNIKQAQKEMTIEDLAVKINASFEILSEKMDSKIDTAIGSLAIMIEKGFEATAKDFANLAERVDRVELRLDEFEKSVDARFASVFSELKEIRKELAANNLKTKGDVASLDFRVGRLEKKVGL